MDERRAVLATARPLYALPSSGCMKVSEIGEEALLEELARRFPDSRKDVALGIGDDAAALTPPEGERILLTVDSLVEGVHFTRKTLPPRFLGRKAVAVSASDIAAMGGRPLGVLLSLTVPGDTDVGTLWHILSGVDERARELETSLLGGNLARSPSGIVVDVTVVGASVSKRMLRRSGARPGDGLYLSGRIGASTTGLELLERGAALAPTGGLIVPDALRGGPTGLAEDCIRAHIDPAPRMALGLELNRKRLATAAIDVSDGLALDLRRLCRASGVGARVEEKALPLAPGLLAWEGVWKRDPTRRALGGGEDYELLWTARNTEKMERLRDQGDHVVTRIGEVVEGDRVELVRRDGTVEPLPSSGWDHFAHGPQGR